MIGYNTKPLADGDTNEIVIGANAIGNGSNTVTLGNDNIVKTFLKGSVGIDTDPTEKLSIYWTTNVDAYIGRGTTDTDVTFIALRNPAGTLYYCYPDGTGTWVCSTTKP